VENSATISGELHALHLHHYCKRKKGGGACKRLKLPNSAASAAESEGGNRDTETNAIIITNISTNNNYVNGIGL